MAVTSSPVLKPIVRACRSKICKTCGLYLNQAPIYDSLKKSNVFWVGLSAVQFEDDEEKLPLSPLTPTGSLIQRIEHSYNNEITFYKTNLVKCVPLKDGRIRYPFEHEMEKCFPNFEWELEYLSPNTVFLLGKQVANFVLKKLANYKPSLNEEFRYNPVEINGVCFIPVHHPSYVLVYKRKNLNQYIKSIQSYF